MFMVLSLPVTTNSRSIGLCVETVFVCAVYALRIAVSDLRGRTRITQIQ